MKFGLGATMVSGLLSRPSPAIRGPFVSAASRMEPSMVGRKGLAGGTANGRLTPRLLEEAVTTISSGNASGIVTVGPDPIVGNLLNRVYNEIYAAREGLG